MFYTIVGQSEISGAMEHLIDMNLNLEIKIHTLILLIQLFYTKDYGRH